jgi:hypothetical protein
MASVLLFLCLFEVPEATESAVALGLNLAEAVKEEGLTRGEPFLVSSGSE